MRRLWILMVAVMAFGALVAIAPAAGAASSPSPKFCAAIEKIGTASPSSATEIAKSADQFKTAGKYAPKNVQNAANTIQKVLKQVKNYAKNPTDLAKLYSSSGYKNYGSAITTFFTYAADCASSDLGGTTSTTSG